MDQSNKGKVIEFPRPKAAPKVLHQIDLAEERYLALQIRELRAELQVKRLEILEALQGGASIEHGTRTARAQTRTVLIIK